MSDIQTTPSAGPFRLELFSRAEVPSSITCSLFRTGSRLKAVFLLENVQDLVSGVSTSARPSRPARKNELWRQTCFELFIAPGTASTYLELNAALSGDWNGYLFDDYRTGMHEAPIGPLQIASRYDSKEKPALREVIIEADLSTIPLLNASNDRSDWTIGISAVLSRENPDRLEYWALAHKSPNPDFHNRAAFLVQL